MNTVFFIFWTNWDLDYAISLELMERELKQGHQVTVYYCNGSCIACASNGISGIQTCRFCTLKIQKTLSLLSQKVKMVPLSSIKVNTKFRMPEVNWTLNDLSRVSCDGFYFCRSILSATISMTRVPFPDWEAQKSELLPQFKDNLIIYRKCAKILQTQSVDKVFVYNGRLSYTRAIFDACQNCKVPVTTYDFGCDYSHFQIYENHLPHDVQYNQSLFKKIWTQAIETDRKKAVAAACDFFIKRRNKTRTGVKLFTLDQQDRKLPDDFDETSNNIVIYCSSEDEFIAVSDEWKHLWFSDQFDAISQIIRSLEPDAAARKIKIYVRLHPNMLHQDKSYTQKYYTLKNHFTEVISCESPVDSYYLLEKASKIVVFGSTVGVEAAFWKNPAILADMAFYRGMNIALDVSNLQELRKAILSEQNFVPDMEMVYAYGYYYEAGGFPFQYVTHENGKNICFKNTLLNSPGLYEPDRWHWKTILQKVDILFNKTTRSLKYFLYERFQYKR